METAPPATVGSAETTRTLAVPAEHDGKRLDIVLASLLDDVTRSAAQKLIADERVAMDRGAVRASRLVAEGERVVVRLAPIVPMVIAPTTGDLTIIYSDDDIVVVDKPAGLTVHPGAGTEEDTLVGRLLGYDPTIAGAGDETRPGIVHRLDKDTSGILVVARTPVAHAALARQWRDRSVTKRYKALVEGTPRRPEGTIETPIARDRKNRKRMAPDLAGRPALTTYRIEETYPGFALLDVTIETGRTHQIRVHLAAIGHPVAGDKLYGARRPAPGLTRQFLHAYLLGLRLPSTGEYHEFVSPLPPDLDAVLSALPAGHGRTS